MSPTLISRRIFLLGLSALALEACCKGNSPGPSSLSLARKALDLEPMFHARREYFRSKNISSEMMKDFYLHRNFEAIQELVRRQESDIIRGIIREGDFRVSSLALDTLAFSSDACTDKLFEQMIKGSEFEESIATLTLCQRAYNQQTQSGYISNTIKQLIGNVRGGVYPFIDGALKQCRDYMALITYNQASPALNPFNNWVIDEPFILTAFFRQPFVLRDLNQRLSSGQVILWDIGCSIGQNAISTLIHLREELPDSPVHIIGTDINPYLLAYARRGLFELDAPSLLSLRGSELQKDIEIIKAHFQNQGWPLSHLDRYLRPFVRALDGKTIYQTRQSAAQHLEFAYDDITDKDNSIIPDKSIGAAFYFNVHYLLPEREAVKALWKIKEKLKPGALLYVQDPNLASSRHQFETVFGPPINILHGNLDIETVLVFRIDN